MYGSFKDLDRFFISDNTIVTSYSVNLNEVDGRKMSDEENWAEEALKIDDPVRSNGIVDMREKFVDHLCNKSAEKDTKAAIGAEQRKPGGFLIDFYKRKLMSNLPSQSNETRCD